MKSLIDCFTVVSILNTVVFHVKYIIINVGGGVELHLNSNLEHVDIEVAKDLFD